ncbi:MAG: hypothetical protein R3C19_00020 [Planctomycetaceae bacterium]
MTGFRGYGRRRRVLSSFGPIDIEKLEDRLLLTGNVSVEISRGDIRISGDRSDNVISITLDNTGLTISGANGTTVNRVQRLVIPPGRIPAEIDDVFINMAGGNDTVQANIAGVSVRHDVRVNLGAGNDRLTVTGGSVGRDATVLGGPGNDVVQWEMFSVADDLNVLLGGGNNSLTLTNGEVGDNATIFGGGGIDLIFVNSVQVADDATISTFGRNDQVTVMNSQVGNTVRIQLGAGNDQLTVSNSQVGNRTIAGGGAGRDTLNVTTSLFGRTPRLTSFETLLGDLANTMLA